MTFGRWSQAPEYSEAAAPVPMAGERSTCRDGGGVVSSRPSRERRQCWRYAQPSLLRLPAIDGNTRRSSAG